jgi:hypothetical protein
MPKRGNSMTPPDDVGEIAEALLGDGEAPVRVRTVAARVHYRRLLINRGPSPTETLRRLYAQRRRAVVDLARWWL